MTGNFMNTANRQNVEMADLVGHRGLIGIYGSEAGCITSLFQGFATGFQSASSHFILFWTPMLLYLP